MSSIIGKRLKSLGKRLEILRKTTQNPWRNVSKVIGGQKGSRIQTRRKTPRQIFYQFMEILIRKRKPLFLSE